jgi:two-component system LytT family response regulator
MSTITALLVDDEPKAIERLAGMLESFPGIDVIGTARSVDDAERFLAGRVPNVVFLDVNMPGRLGVDLVASVPKSTKIVFVTAHEAHAVEAFRAGAIDYLLKPFDRDRLVVTLERLEAAVPSTRNDEAVRGGDEAAEGGRIGEASHDTPDAVTLSMHRGRAVDVVPYVEIAWIEAVQNYSRVQARGRDAIVVRRTMQEWEALLPGAAFRRISRSLIVNLPAIRSTQWQSRDQTLLFFIGVEASLPIGRTAMTRLKELLGSG